MNRPISKPVLIIILLIVLAVIGFFVYTHTAKQNLPQSSVPETVPVPTKPSAWPSAKVREETITDNKSYYDISAVYPVTSDTVINSYFKKYVDDAVAEFKDDTSWAAGDGANSAPAEAGELSLDVTYKEEKSSRADNYIFSTVTYTGGAHGLEVTKTFSFSPTGQLISLATLFTNENAGLKAISTYVKAQLAKTLPKTDQSFIDDGAAPTESNYQNFTIQDDGVTFMFDAYQVAPYSDGQQVVKVPLSVFKDAADPTVFTQ